jgi:hypothetical protein
VTDRANAAAWQLVRDNFESAALHFTRALKTALGEALAAFRRRFPD